MLDLTKLNFLDVDVSENIIVAADLDDCDPEVVIPIEVTEDALETIGEYESELGLSKDTCEKIELYIYKNYGACSAYLQVWNGKDAPEISLDAETESAIIDKADAYARYRWADTLDNILEAIRKEYGLSGADKPSSKNNIERE